GEQPTTEGATSAPGEATTVPGVGEQPTTEGATPGEATPAPGEATPVPGGEQPATTPTTPEQPTAAGPSVPPEQANPAPVAPGTVLQADNWSYNFPNANYAVYLGNQAGGQTAQGEFVHVLVFVANNTGNAQPIPADFFVLKDSQGRVFAARPDVSSALVQRGVNADLGMQDNVPANGTTTSVYMVFDVAADANGLVLFARSNPNQGWQLTPIR
ncbi:MAG TPA: hypothetical protein VFT99_21075, partial [Roseiflexaceae bacterium]|nr:hypothetical protein [Roseiflexaceae bacterium]